MTTHLTNARHGIRGFRSLLTAAVVVTLALSLLTMTGPTANAAGPASINLGAAASFAVLSAADGGGGAVTCVNTPGPTSIIGDVGSSGLAASAVIPAGCVISGSVIAPVPHAVVAAFDNAYAKLALVPCTQTILAAAFTGATAAFSVDSGVICFPAAVTFTDTTLTLTGNGPWLFKVGTSGTGALTGTNFHMVMPIGADPCDVTWWVAEAASMDTSQFIGTIIAGAAITVTSGGVGTFHGRALAKAAVTITGGTLTGCTSDSIGVGGGGGGNGKAKCNQGVGNGPEACDPGNSNQGDPSRSNDELGGTPGNPGRKGGNGK